MAYQRKTFKPRDLHMVLMNWNGYTNQEIAAFFGVTTFAVMAALQSEEAKSIFADLRTGAMDTMLSVHSMAQAIAPKIMEEKISLALTSKSEQVRSVACKDILAIAGHTPLQRVSIERPDSTRDKYKDRSMEELRKELLTDLGLLKREEESVSDVPADRDPSTGGLLH